MADFKVKEKKGKVTATHSIKTQKCNAQGKNCKNFTYEDIVLTLTKEGDLEISIKATTGSDANGDTFANSIDAENFDGDGSGTYPDTLFLQVDLGGFNFNDADSGNVTATVEVATSFQECGIIGRQLVGYILDRNTSTLDRRNANGPGFCDGRRQGDGAGAR